MRLPDKHEEEPLLEEALNPSYEVDIRVVEVILLRELIRAELATDKVSVSEAVNIACPKTINALRPIVEQLTPAVFQCSASLGESIEEALKKSYSDSAKLHVGLALLAAACLTLNQIHYEEQFKKNG